MEPRDARYSSSSGAALVLAGPWLPLTGKWGLDWGVCSNPDSPNDRTAVFEHDGCAGFEEADEWVVPED